MALAIELAAARVPSLGLDGIEAGLADRMRLLTGGRGRTTGTARCGRRSTGATRCWTSRTRRCCAGSRCSRPRSPRPRRRPCWPAGRRRPAARSGAALARLADQSLLVAVADAAGTRYRALETIRQYGADQLGRAGESDQASARHLSWCLDAATALGTPDGAGRAWRSAFDQVADELRAALGWAAARAGQQPEAYRLAISAGRADLRPRPARRVAAAVRAGRRARGG